jgi:hypothetical protein
MPLKEIPEKLEKNTKRKKDKIIRQYDDKGVLLVNECYIPSDYEKPFAVSTRSLLNGLLEKGYKLIEDKEDYPYINGKKKFARVLVQKI